MKNNKPAELRSVPIQTQLYGDCWAHAICRNFVRTLQVLDVIKSKYNKQFYDLFYSVLTENKDCYEGGNMSDLFILFDFLKLNYKVIFDIASNKSECFKGYCSDAEEYKFLENMDPDHKIEFIDKMADLFDRDILFIGAYTYTINPSGNNKPSLAIRKMLECKLQPYVTIRLNRYLKNLIDKTNPLQTQIEDNKPYIPDIKKYNNSCITDSYSHAVNLRRWKNNYVEFKNSWGGNVADSGNFSVSDLKYLICDKHNIVEFASLMFKYDQIKNILPYNETFDPNLEIKNEDQELSGFYDSYGLLNGNVTVYFSNLKYEGDISNGFREGRGKATYTNDDIYEGKWKNNKIEGNGEMKLSDGRVYNGEWKNENREGYGIMRWPDGEVYEGKWKKNNREGYGITRWPDGRVYNGEWKNGKIDGSGKMTYSEDIVYEGEWVDGLREGNGKMTLIDEIYEGEWKNGYIEGSGIYRWKNGDIYKGEWKKDLREGNGEMTWLDGRVYEGEWKNDNIEGIGIYRWKNGDIYEGKMKNNLKEGNGKMTWKSGNTYKGEWKNDNVEGIGICRWKNGDIYEGEWKNNLKEGKGEMRWPDGCVYVGEWKNDNREGNGEMTWPDGRVYVGEWKNDNIEGMGKMKWPDKKNNWVKDQIYNLGDMILDYGSISQSMWNNSIYEGDWINYKRDGWGKQTDSQNNIIYEGVWKNDVPLNIYWKTKYIKYKTKYLNLQNQLNR